MTCAVWKSAGRKEQLRRQALAQQEEHARSDDIIPLLRGRQRARHHQHVVLVVWQRKAWMQATMHSKTSPTPDIAKRAM